MTNHTSKTNVNNHHQNLDIEHDSLHVQYTIRVQFLHHVSWRYSNGAYEEGCLALDDDVRELGQKPMRIIALSKNTEHPQKTGRIRESEAGTRGGGTYVGLPGVASYLRHQEIDTKRCVLVLEVALELVNGSLQDFGGLTVTSYDANSAYSHNSHPESIIDIRTKGEGNGKPNSRHAPALQTAAASFGPAATFIPGTI